MKRFIFHHSTTLTPVVTVHWDSVLFKNGMVAVSLIDKVLSFRTLDEMIQRFQSIGSVRIEWLDGDNKS
jgi:hypothetical protein